MLLKKKTDQQLEKIICNLDTPGTSYQNNSSCIKKFSSEKDQTLKNLAENRLGYLLDLWNTNFKETTYQIIQTIKYTYTINII